MKKLLIFCLMLTALVSPMVSVRAQTAVPSPHPRRRLSAVPM
jgi:hypothetical protein